MAVHKEKGINLSSTWSAINSTSTWFAVAALVLAGILVGVVLWLSGSRGLNTILQSLFALLPGSIILTQLVYLGSSRRKQYRDALDPGNQDEATKLEELYFGLMPLTIRYGVPAILVTVLC